MSRAQITWERADLLCWGEYFNSPFGEFRKLWKFQDNTKNEDACVFELRFEGVTIAADIDLSTTDEAEDHIDQLVTEHMKKMEA